MSLIKIAMLGMTHGHTRKYFQVLKENPNLDWVGVATDDAFARENFYHNVSGVPCYDTANELFEAHPDLQAVVIASENSKHFEDLSLCANRGLDVLMMKIPTFDMDEYNQMIDLVKKNKIVCQVELELHYNPVVNRLKEIVTSDKLGKLQAIQATNVTLCPAWAFPWQGSPEKSYGKRVRLSEANHRFRGGALCDHPHIFDLVREMTGSEFEAVYAECAPNLRRDLEVEDMLAINARMKNGVYVSLDPSWSKQETKIPYPGPGWEVAPKRMEVNVTLCGEKGEVFADCFGPNVYHDGGPNNRYTVQYTYFDEWVGLMDEFIDCIRTRKTPHTNLESHKGTIEAMLACYESIATGKVIRL